MIFRSLLDYLNQICRGHLLINADTPKYFKSIVLVTFRLGDLLSLLMVFLGIYFKHVFGDLNIMFFLG